MKSWLMVMKWRSPDQGLLLLLLHSAGIFLRKDLLIFAAIMQARTLFGY
jgi:hypothetical protein